jgi:hypothetical protein
MPRPYEKGIPALCRYQGVKFYHFEVLPGASYVLSADPFSFLQSWLVQRIPKKRSVNRECLNRALYYARLALDFYSSAAGSTFPVRGTLTYYGMLNLVKCFLSVHGVELEKQLEHHGMSLPLGQKQTINVTKPSNGISIFAEFAQLLDRPIKASSCVAVDQVISHIPELHEMAYSLDILPWSKRKYLPVEIDFLVNDAKDKLFTEIRYAKKNEARVDTALFNTGRRKEYFTQRGEENGFMIFRSKRRKSLKRDNFPSIYRNIQRDYEEFNLCSLLTRSGYRYYCDLRPGQFHHLSDSLALLFYLGSIARYRPAEVEELTTGKLSPIVNEALAVIPQQFLYQLVSLTTNSVCVVPQAKLE